MMDRPRSRPRSYGEVAAALEALHEVEPAARPAFTARLDNLKKLGVPLNQRVGRGRKIEYGLSEFCQVAFALEITSAGIDPSLAVDLIERGWHQLFPWFQLAMIAEEDVWLGMVPRVLASRLTTDTEALSIPQRVRPEWAFTQRRALLFNLSAIVRGIGIIDAPARHTEDRICAA